MLKSILRFSVLLHGELSEKYIFPDETNRAHVLPMCCFENDANRFGVGAAVGCKDEYEPFGLRVERVFFAGVPGEGKEYLDEVLRAMRLAETVPFMSHIVLGVCLSFMVSGRVCLGKDVYARICETVPSETIQRLTYQQLSDRDVLQERLQELS